MKARSRSPSAGRLLVRQNVDGTRRPYLYAHRLARLVALAIHPGRQADANLLAEHFTTDQRLPRLALRLLGDPSRVDNVL